MENELIFSLDKISDSLKKLEVCTKSINEFTGQILKLNESCINLSNTTENMDSTNILDYINSFNMAVTTANNVADLEKIVRKLGGTINNITPVFLGTELATKLATAATTVFSEALTFLAGHPIIAVIGAIGLVVGAFAIFNTSNDEVVEKTDQVSESIEKQRERLDELNESLASTATNHKDKINSIMGEYSVLSTCIDKLQELGKDNSTVKNVEQAKYYMEQINGILPDSVKLTADNKIEWIKSADAIKKNIELIKEKAIADQQMAKSQEIFGKELEIKREFAQAQQEYNGSLREFATLKEREGELSDQEKLRYAELQEQLPQLEENYYKASFSMSELGKATSELTLSTEALSGTAAEKGAYMAEVWTQLNEDGTVSFASLGTALNEFNLKYQELSNSNSEASQKEAEIYKEASKNIKETMIDKAYQYGLSYSQMIDLAKKNGIELNAIDLESLKRSYDQYKQNGDARLRYQLENNGQSILNEQMMFTDLSVLQKGQLSNALERFIKAGDDQGFGYMLGLFNTIKENNGKVDELTQKMIDDLEERAKNADPRIKVNVDEPTENEYENINTSADKGLKDQTLGVNVKPNGSGFSILGYKINFNWWPFAEGGFPETGELFVAREAGPELVGRINGKTAVANNDQIVSGISSGVYNAVRSAMQGKGGNGNMNIHATFVMDGEVVGKQVIKYHNGVVKRTGTTPLMI